MPQTIQPHCLAQALDDRRGVKMLSLDCFDTLLWRDVNAPTDLFALLGDITPQQRIRAEMAARKRRALGHAASTEVTLREIYAELLPHADDATRAAHVAHELAIEMRHCYAFAATVALIREAKRRDLRVIVVSDTYFERNQLEALIRAAAGDAVADLIDAIYCSCEHRSAKSEALFAVMLKQTSMRPDRILHIGDNVRADAIAAERHGIRALHLVQFADTTVQRLRQEAAAGALMATGGAAFQPHRATIALGEPQLTDDAAATGFAALGPIMTAFARWTAREAAAIAAARGGKVHLLYLMRDGHLPREVFTATIPGVRTHGIEISRFAATAASLTDAAAIRRFIIEEIGDGAGKEFLRQLLIVGDEATALLATLPTGDAPLALADALLSDAWTDVIVARGRAYADRLTGYIRSVVTPTRGDTLMLVDLGYNGSVQNRVAALLTDAFGVHVAGRYLLLNEQEPSALDKRGMIDRRDHDVDALYALTGSVAILEQFCTVAQGSVVDYTDSGTPLRAAIGIKGRQSEIRDGVQAGCVAYARADGDAVIRVHDAAAAQTDCRAATAALARLLFLPLPHELALMAQFEHDTNLGTDETVALFDPDLAARGLRERGLFYMKGARRMFLPAELRGQGLPTSLALLTQRRFGLDLRYADFCDRAIALPVLLVDGNDAFADTVQAMPTHEGYHVAAIPIGAGRYTVGAQFGRNHEWLQIDSVAFMPVAAFLAGEPAAAVTVAALPSLEGMTQVAPFLFRCDGPDAFLMVPPPPILDPAVPMMLAVVFRPLVARAAPIDPVPAQPVLTGALA